VQLPLTVQSGASEPAEIVCRACARRYRRTASAIEPIRT
jgi:hypothetical protein